MKRISGSKTTRGLFVALGTLALAPASHAVNLYNQPTDSNGGYASQNDTNGGGYGNFATAYDDFTLGSAGSVGTVNWVGSYFHGSPGSISSFVLSFYADNAGTPGSVLQTATVSGNANETSLGLDNAGDPAFRYSAALPTAFNAAGGAKYWLSIVPSIGYPPQWAWESGTGGNGSSYQSFLGSNGRIDNDLAFSMDSSPPAATPEPGSVALLIGVGTAGAGVLRKRRIRRSP